MHNPYAGTFRVTQTWDEHVANGGRPGIDYGMDEGTPLVAPCDGVFHFFLNGDAGFDAVVFAADGTAQRQCHNIDNDVARSLHLTRVTEGQHISFSGNTGTSDGPHVHCNGWGLHGERLPPFGGITTAALGIMAFPTQHRGDDEVQYWQHTNGLVAALDDTRGVYRFLRGFELEGFRNSVAAGFKRVDLLGSPQWEETFAPLRLIHTTEAELEVDDDVDLDALADEIATPPTTMEIVDAVVSVVDQADDPEHHALQAALAALAARTDKLPDNVRNRLAETIAV
ncbi:MAG: putative M23-family peptidase [Rhodoglobus sp.]|nr:putative M23-family peptidase [Rhodoglobus sp.]